MQIIVINKDFILKPTYFDDKCKNMCFIVKENMYCKVESDRPVYYSNLELCGKGIKFPLHKPFENLKTCY